MPTVRTRRTRILLRILRALSVAAMIAFGVRHARPGTAKYASLVGVPASTESVGRRLRVTFVGTATLLFDDGETAWMTDAFFDRVRMARVAFGTIAPDPVRVRATLARLGVTKLAAVVPIHSHYDHALDSALVANETGALLVGSRSTANLGRGGGVVESRIRVVSHGETLAFGRFKVTFFVSEHSPGDHYPGTIDAPVVPPARANAWKTGECYALLVEHDGRSILVNGSSGFRKGLFGGRHADVVYLGIGSIGRLDASFREDYWNEVVRAVTPGRVFAIHWDDFFVPLDEPLVPLPWIADDMDTTMDFLLAKGASERVDVRIPAVFVPEDPFAGLP
ncbi:MAG: MBL fold metallo-hydrolase [Polyangiaceae bacterium]